MNHETGRILIIEKDHNCRRELVDALSTIVKNDALFISEEINQGIEQLKSEPVHLILLHLDSETQSGFFNLGMLKSDIAAKNIPVLLYHSSNSTPAHLQSALEAGADAFICDAMSGQQIAALLRTLTRYTEKIKLSSELQDQVELFNQFSLHSPIYMFIKEVTSSESRVVQSSENFIEMIGIPGSQMVGKTMEELFPLEFAKKINADDWDVVTKGEVFREEETFNNKTYLTIKFPIYLAGRTLLAGYTIDINEQKTTEEALRNSEEHFRSIVGNSDAGYFFIDKAGMIKDVNEAWVRLYRYESADEIIGQHFTKIQKIDDVQAAQDFVEGIMRNDPNYLKGEFSRLCKDGSVGYHTYSARPVSRDNEVIGIEGFIIDTTEHRLTIEALRTSEERYHLIDEASQDYIYSYDLQSRFTHVNSRLCESFGVTPDYFLGKTHEEAGFPQELCDAWAVLHRQVFDSDATVISETTAPLPDGTVVNFEVVLNPIHDSGGKIIGIAGTTRNIHDRKMAEKKIKEQMLELQQWNTITMGREDRILELKREINQLLEEQGQPPRYKSVGNGRTSYPPPEPS